MFSGRDGGLTFAELPVGLNAFYSVAKHKLKMAANDPQ